MATIIIPKYLKSNYSGWFPNFFHLTIDGENFDDAGKYLVAPGRRVANIDYGVLAPSGTVYVRAESGKVYKAFMEQQGMGSRAAYVFGYIEVLEN